MRVVNPSMTQTPMQQQMPDASGNSFGGPVISPDGNLVGFGQMALPPGTSPADAQAAYSAAAAAYVPNMPPNFGVGMKPPIYPSPPNLGVGRPIQPNPGGGKPILGNPKGGISVRGGGMNDAISGGGGGMRNPPALGQLPLGPGQPNSSGLTPNVPQVLPNKGPAYKKGGVVKASPKRKGGTVKSDKPVVRGRGCATKGHGKMRMY